MTQKNLLGAPSGARAVVVGGGTMGADVAVVLLRADCRTCVVEPNRAQHDTIRERIEANLQAIGKQNNLGLLRVASSVDDLDWADVNLMIECVPEVLDIKRALFKTLADKAPAHVILASNSSSFPISQVGEGLATQERMVGLHFFMPAHIVPLVEVVMGPATDQGVADAMIAFMRRCGSVPILVRKDVPGFIANRLQHALGREAFSLIEEGIATPEDIDAAVRFGFGFRYLAAGPIMQKEHAGLDVHAAAAATIYPSLSNASVPPPVLADKPKNGTLGMKSGQGFYKWSDADIKAERQRYNRVLRAGLEILADELPEIKP
ncbi:3-hydroxyacyl-CoA dehydrogenase family protein [Paralcaligenes ginsengisoli]